MLSNFSYSKLGCEILPYCARIGTCLRAELLEGSRPRCLPQGEEVERKEQSRQDPAQVQEAGARRLGSYSQCTRSQYPHEEAGSHRLHWKVPSSQRVPHLLERWQSSGTRCLQPQVAHHQASGSHLRLREQ